MEMSTFMNRSTTYPVRIVTDRIPTSNTNFWSTGDVVDNSFEDLEKNVYIHQNLTEPFFNSTGNPDVHNITIRDEFIPGWKDFALVILFCSVIAGTVIGNTLVIAAVATTRRLRTVTNCFVMSLAVADWLVGMFVMPFKVPLYLVGNEWHFGRILCELWISLDILLCTASILSLCAISIDRYLAITRPLAYSRKRRSKRLALSMISCVWVAAVVITSPPIFGWYDSDRDPNKCEYNENTGYVVYSALGSFFIPLLVMLYVYARIACVIAHRQRTIEKIQNSTQKKCCEEPEERKKDETQVHVLYSMQEDHNRVERSSSSSASHTMSASKLHVEKDINFWSRLRLNSSPGKNHQSSIKSERSRSNGNERKRGRPSSLGKVLGGNNTSRASNTGSRLCNHSVSTLSPQRSINRGRPSVNIISYSDGDLTTGCNYTGDVERVWTVEGSEQSSSSRPNTLNGRLRNCSGEALSCDNTRLGGDNSVTELQSRVYPTQSQNASPGLAAQHPHNLQQNQQQSHHHLHSHLYHHHVHGGGGLLPSACGGGGNNLQVQSISSQKRSIKSNQGLHVTMPTAGGSDQNQNAASREYTSGRVASFKRETKTAQTLAAVVGGFIICWLPFFVAYVIGPFIPKDVISNGLMDALIWLGWGNSAINPFIYAFYSPDFRSAFLRLTLHKVEGLFRTRRGNRSSPRRYDDTMTGKCQKASTLNKNHSPEPKI